MNNAPGPAGGALTELECEQLAIALSKADAGRVVIPQISTTQPHATLVDAYAIQGRWLKLKQAEGHRRIGRKIGLTSRAMQLASKIEEPDYGFLTSDMLYRDRDRFPANRFIAPRLHLNVALSGERIHAACAHLNNFPSRTGIVFWAGTLGSSDRFGLD